MFDYIADVEDEDIYDDIDEDDKWYSGLLTED